MLKDSFGYFSAILSAYMLLLVWFGNLGFMDDLSAIIVIVAGICITRIYRGT